MKKLISLSSDVASRKTRRRSRLLQCIIRSMVQDSAEKKNRVSQRKSKRSKLKENIISKASDNGLGGILVLRVFVMVLVLVN